MVTKLKEKDSANKIKDKNGKEIKAGDIILISNSRGCYNRKAKAEIINDKFTNHKDVLGYRLLDGYEIGKKGFLTTWINAIWCANDTPENFLEVLDEKR